MIDSVIETKITRILAVNHESQLFFTNTKIRLPHGLGSVAILILACGLHRVAVSRTEAHWRVAKPYVVIR